MRPAKIAAIVGGALLVLIGVGLVLPGGFLLWAHGTQRDSAGFYETSSRVLSTSTYALTTPDVDLEEGPWTWIPEGETAAVRLQAEPTGTTPLFIGIGPTDRVSEYLSGVAHDEVASLDGWFLDVDYRTVGGSAPATAPGEQGFWVAKQEGSGVQTLEWPVQSGNWTAVMMNADGSAQVTSAVSLGARFGILIHIAIGLTVTGVILLAVGIVLIVLGVRRPRPTRPAPTAEQARPFEPQAQA